MELEEKDEHSRSVFLIKRSEDALKNVETYLRNRNWNVYSFFDIKKAIVSILQTKPKFVVMSVEHPNPKASVLPKILNQALNCYVIPYAENSSPLILNKLNDFQSDLVIFPPVSGPAIDRMLAGIILKENEQGSQNSKMQMRANFAGKISDKDQHVVAVKGARAALEKLFHDEDNDSSIGVLGHLEQSGVPQQKMDIIIQKGAKGPKFFMMDQEEHESSISTDTNLFVAKQEYNSILIEAVKEALEKNSEQEERGEADDPQPLSPITNVSCIVVHSTKYAGYLVVAMGHNKKIEELFLKNLKEHLFSFLKAIGENLTAEDQLQLSLEPVDFQSWAIEQAEFLRKSIHHGDDVAVAFFSRAEVHVKFEKSFNSQMIALDLEEIRGDVQIEFDAYIHMPINNKYILYTPKGGVFYSNQKERLLRSFIKKIHLRKDSVEDAKKYMVQNYLNDKINEFKESAASMRKQLA